VVPKLRAHLSPAIPGSPARSLADLVHTKQPDLWQFGVVFGPSASGPKESQHDFEAFLAAQCRIFVSAGFTLGLAERTPQTRDKVIVLLRMSEDAMLSEFRRLQIQRWKQTGAGIEFQLKSDASQRDIDHFKLGAEGGPICEKLRPTRADVVQVLAEVLNHRCGLGDIEHLHDRYTNPADPRIHSCFPIKDREWERVFMQRWMKEGGVMKSFRMMSQVRATLSALLSLCRRLLCA
jgi:hypothetical protein